MARYKEYGYDIQDGKAIIPEWESEIKEGAKIIRYDPISLIFKRP